MQQTTDTRKSQYSEPDVGRDLATNIALDSSWKSRLEDEFQLPYMKNLKAFLVSEKKLGKVIFPPGPEMFTALNATKFENVRVVILGQDHYHGPGQAHGLSFSVKDGVAFPPSLQNIFKELSTDIGCPIPKSGNLLKWAQNGVLLLNASLSVEQSKPMSHQNSGWEQFTNKIIHLLNDEGENIVFILWGSFAQKKAQFVDRKKHYVIASPHPSPLPSYRGFFGSKPFSKANAFLVSKNLKPINWILT